MNRKYNVVLALALGILLLMIGRGQWLSSRYRASPWKGTLVLKQHKFSHLEKKLSKGVELSNSPPG